MELAKGTIGFIKVFEIPAEKQKANRFGKTPTHRISFVLQEQDGVWFNVGETTKDHLDVKDKGEWKTLSKGFGVEFIYDKNGNYNNVKVSNIKITSEPENTPTAAPQGDAAPKKPYSRKVSTGDLVGHAIKCVCGMGIKPTAPEFLDTAKKVYDLSAGLKAAYKAENPDLTDYEVGAPIGMAIEQLSRLEVKLEDMPAQVKQILEMQDVLKSYIDEGGNPVSVSLGSLGNSDAPVNQTQDLPEQDFDFDDDLPF